MNVNVQHPRSYNVNTYGGAWVELKISEDADVPDWAPEGVDVHYHTMEEADALVAAAHAVRVAVGVIVGDRLDKAAERAAELSPYSVDDPRTLRLVTIAEDAATRAEDVDDAVRAGILALSGAPVCAS